MNFFKKILLTKKYVDMDILHGTLKDFECGDITKDEALELILTKKWKYDLKEVKMVIDIIYYNYEKQRNTIF